ncbi:alkyl hydroperoxide reductase/ thiol specific antioxidant/ Mal allergen [Halorubrum coriense DSM 10284]|uniref:Alkyl hydroperoxide reductase/ thiol specific antioxidant/ Mal allergen n=1 Tax=Halorubrum coriense DSM 10284 TaxID=1227466 RepID=M0E8G2_9EURY|nr:redoxin domain-containing protein [Halorubrum coriense]ELZ44101.1 alkyl hydroperoxide reductase/ thiol specific antioxidant/ Mal allergen [Halorubrum coriense DSM 10284]
MVTVGDTAPDFAAPAVGAAHGGDAERTATELALFRLVEAHDAVVLCVAPATFVPTCTAALAAVRDAGWHDRDDLAVVALTGDSLYAAFAYADRFALPFPVVADFHGGVADSYDLLADSWEGHSAVPRRAAVVIDGDWTVRFAAATDDPLDRADPAPVERAAETLRDLGLDVDRPRVDYDGPW